MRKYQHKGKVVIRKSADKQLPYGVILAISFIKVRMAAFAFREDAAIYQRSSRKSIDSIRAIAPSPERMSAAARKKVKP